MTNTEVNASRQPMTSDGDQRTIFVGRHSITVIRDTRDAFRVVTQDASSKIRVDCFCADFTAERLPVDLSVEDAARTFARGIWTTLRGQAETPAGVVARVKAYEAAKSAVSGQVARGRRFISLPSER